MKHPYFEPLVEGLFMAGAVAVGLTFLSIVYIIVALAAGVFGH